MTRGLTGAELLKVDMMLSTVMYRDFSASGRRFINEAIKEGSLSSEGEDQALPADNGRPTSSG